MRGAQELLRRAKRVIGADGQGDDDESRGYPSHPIVMTAGIVLNRGRTLSGGEDMSEAYCGGCQTQLKFGHRAGCPAIEQDIMAAMGKEGESRCMDCNRPESLGHDMDCSEVVSRYGVELGGW